MKKIFLLSLIAGAISFVMLESSSSGYRSSVTGATGAATGPAAGCSCHGAQSNNITVTVELDSNGTAVNRYSPGGNYTIKLSGINTGSGTLPKFGFQLASVLANSSFAGGAIMAGQPGAVQAGTWGTMPTGAATSTSGSVTLVNHNTPKTATTGTGSTGTTYVINIPWTAPSAGSGAIMLYGVILAVNGNGSDAGDNFNIAKNLFIPEIGHESACR